MVDLANQVRTVLLGLQDLWGSVVPRGTLVPLESPGLLVYQGQWVKKEHLAWKEHQGYQDNLDRQEDSGIKVLLAEMEKMALMASLDCQALLERVSKQCPKRCPI